MNQNIMCNGSRCNYLLSLRIDLNFGDFILTGVNTPEKAYGVMAFRTEMAELLKRFLIFDEILKAVNWNLPVRTLLCNKREPAPDPQ